MNVYDHICSTAIKLHNECMCSSHCLLLHKCRRKWGCTDSLNFKVHKLYICSVWGPHVKCLVQLYLYTWDSFALSEKAAIITRENIFQLNFRNISVRNSLLIYLVLEIWVKKTCPSSSQQLICIIYGFRNYVLLWKYTNRGLL